MILPVPTRRGAADHRPAFALVTAVLLMVLITILATGMLSLSAVALRESSAATADLEARANARLALQLAIAQLQEHAGVDAAITAGGDAGSKRWTGVWAPMPPVGVAGPDYAKDARFRTWLVSTPRSEDARGPALPQLAQGAKVAMADRGTMGADASDAERVAVPTIPLGKGPGSLAGAMAWWTSDESTKARVDLRSDDEMPDLSGKISLQLTPSRPGTGQVAAFTGITGDDPRLERGITRDSIGLLTEDGPGAVRRHWHDITTASVGLLTDARDLRLRPYAMPWKFNITHNGNSRSVHHLDILPYHSWWMNFPARIELEPGESRVYSNNAATPLDVSWTSDTGAQIELSEGWTGTGGYYAASKGFAGSGPVTITMDVADGAHYEQSGGWAGSRICLLYWSTYAEGGRTDWNMETWFEIPKISQNGLLRIDGAPNTGLTFENLAARKTEICSFNIALKTPADRRWPSRSWIHGNPCDANNHMIVYQRNSGGALEPLELAQNRMAISVAYAGDIDLIQIEVPPSNAGFIASGNTAGDGVSHAVHQELPVAPIQSLAQFQHANLISTGFAPFQSKALGNSLAHPMVRPDRSREPAFQTQTNTEECDHSFLIRAYGDARDASGRVIARAWCEALVQRRIDYLDPVDPPEAAPAALESRVNRRFGRRFEMISFRWLNADAI